MGEFRPGDYSVLLASQERFLGFQTITFKMAREVSIKPKVFTIWTFKNAFADPCSEAKKGESDYWMGNQLSVGVITDL